MKERGAGPGGGGKQRTGSATRETKEAESLTTERQREPPRTGEKIPQEKKGPGRKSGHLKEHRASGEPRTGRTRQDARGELAEGPKEEKQKKPPLTGGQPNRQDSP